MEITVEMLLEWNGESSMEDLAVHLCEILNGNISVKDARNEIADYF